MTEAAKNDQLIAYSQEIAPRVRTILKKKEILKEDLEGDEKVTEFREQIKDIQEQLKAYIEAHPDHGSLLEEIKELEKELKTALKGAAKGTEFKPAELKKFFVARAKPEKKAVKKTIEIGETFEDILAELGEPVPT